MRFLTPFLYYALLLSILSCSVEAEKNETSRKNLIIGHRATGEGVKSGFLENTIPAVKEALKYADGVEVDIQMSSSKTLWIYHDNFFNHLCAPSKKLITQLHYSCIPTSPDSLISKLKICRKGVEERFYRLEELMNLVAGFDKKIISLDVKGYFKQECFPKNNVDEQYLRELGEELNNLIIQYDLKNRVFIETNYTFLFKILNDIDPTINCHLLAYNNFNKQIIKAQELHLDGISFNLHDSSLNISTIKEFKNTSLQLQVWSVRNRKDYRRALTFEPFSMQVSDIKLLKSIHQTRRKHPH